MLMTICGRSTTAGIDTGPTATEMSDEFFAVPPAALRV